MLKVLAILMAVILFVPTLGYMVFSTGRYMIAQGMDFDQAVSWSWDDWTDILASLVGGSNAESEDYWECEININRNVDVVACVDLKW